MFAAENPLDRLIHAVQLLEGGDIENKNIKKLINDTENIKEFRRKQNYAENILEEISEELSCEEKKYNYNEIDKIIPLRNYLYSYISKNSFIPILLESITSLHKDIDLCWRRKKESDNIKCFRLFLVSRYTTGGFYSMQDKKDNNIFVDSQKLTAIGVMQGNSYSYSYSCLSRHDRISDNTRPCVYSSNKIKYAILSGRYDAMSFVKVRPLFGCPLPYFGTHPYQFPSILTRREFGIRVDLNCDEKKCIHQTERLAGYISVVLKRRSFRLPFIARILASVNKNYIFPFKKEKIFEYLRKETDTILLLDGSADLLIVIRCKSDKDSKQIKFDKQTERAGDIMDLAYCIYQDFMVNRTEVILSASAIEGVAMNIANNDKTIFNIDCEIRCFEDRLLDKDLDDFIKQIENNLDETKGKNKLFVNIELTAGRKDFLLRFFPYCKDDCREKLKEIFPRSKSWRIFSFNDYKFRDELQKILEGKFNKQKGEIIKGAGGYYIDRIEVNVNKQPPKHEDPFEGNKGEN